MTTHARGGLFLDPDARAAVDIGTLNGRAISIDGRGKVLSDKMTSQCASGSSFDRRSCRNAPHSAAPIAPA